VSTRRRVKHIPDLDPLEERLSDRIKGVNIIDELSIDRELRTQLQEAFDYHLQRRGLQGLLRSYTTCFAVHLVAEGIYGYESGNYWGGTPLKERSSQNDVREAGKFFETFVETHGLETFPDRPFRYVSLILLHCSIPNDLLPAFFEYALNPAVHDPEWHSLDVRELIQRWPRQPPSNNRLPKVAHTFFQKGGEVAVDFVSRCLEMAEKAASSGEVPSADKVRLPERIVENYSDWREDHEKEKGKTRSRRSRTRRRSVEPPRIWIDPWQTQIMVDLPEQKFESGQRSDETLGWKVEAKSRAEISTTEVDVHTFKSGETWKSEPESVPLVAPARSYDVSLTGLSSSYSWTFEGLSPDNQLLVFDGDTQEIIESPQGLPSRPLWLVYPHGEDPDVDGGQQVQAERPLYGPWADFATSCWDLSSADSVTIGDTNWPVVSQGQGLQPRLLGGDQLPIGGNRDKYYTQLPEIRIPVSPDRESEEEVEQWEWRLVGEGESPTVQQLDSKQPEVSVEEHALTLSLARVIDHIGNFEVGVRGPLGRSANFSISYVGDCSIQLPTDSRLPNEDGSYPPKRVVVSTASDVELSCSRDDMEINSSDTGVHRVVFGGTCTQASIQMHPHQSESSIELPIVAPGIRWKLQGEGWNQTWSTRPLRLAVDEIEQSSDAELIVRNQPASSAVDLQGELRVEDDQELLQSIGSKSRAAGRLRFDLLEILDLLRQTDRSLQLQLEVEPNQATTVARLEASLEVEDLSIRTDRSGDVWDLMVTWETSGKPVRNRRLRLWSVGRPWESPRTFEIPDDARGGARFQRPISKLPAGPYIAALELEDPWQESFPERPSQGDPNATVVRIGSVGSRLKKFWEAAPSLERHLEQAFLADDVSDSHRHLREASEMISGEDVSTLLRALWWVDSSGSLAKQVADKQNVVVRWIRSEVLNHPKALTSSVSNREFRNASKNRLQRFLVTLGTPQALVPAGDWENDTLDLAWQTWGPLGWMLEVRNILDDENRSVRRARSATGIDELVAQDDGNSASDTASASTPTTKWKSLKSDTDVFGGRPQEKLLSLPAPILREQQHRLNATLRGHFDDERSWQAVNFDWLLNHKEHSDSRRPSMSVFEEFRNTLRSGVEHILESGYVAESVANSILNRRDPRPDAKLANVPFCTGATALIQRVYAIHGITLPFVGPEALAQCGLKAFDIARRLYERDLC